ncbi:threonine aldolase family protein [Afifella sp. JA880]|uniref:threonine aldolase family protein n=1 Tax=Afifella sp. JA880 TaxID=2975280 RepID=UPI0021BA7590|nr:threonine aldolase family protein [Afifella sp. JA880]MCT8266518.1 threonine aldolase family protein [Afifella sp. JA880]
MTSATSATSAIAIDLVSDTSTRPSRDMLARMMAAETGDEQRGEDPTVLQLCERIADLLGMDDALFLPSGTMCNQIAFLVHCRPGDEIIAAESAHVFGSEGAGASALAGAQFHTIATPNGIFDAAAVAAHIRAPRMRRPRSRVVAVEQTTNRGGGAVWSVDELAAIVALAREHSLAVHMDGARLFNAVVAANTPAKAFTAGFDSAWIDLSKGLGCPVGGVLAGSKDFIAEAWHWKHRLGGAMRQSGILAAAGLYALDHNVNRLAEDHANARLFADTVRGLDGVTLSPENVVTNILFLELDEGLDAGTIGAKLQEKGMRIGVEGPHRMRVVTHLDVTRDGVKRAAEAFVEIVQGMSA